MSLRYANIVLGVVLLALSAWLIASSLSFRDPRTGQMPIVLAAFFILASVLLIALNAVPRTGRAMERQRPFAEVPWFRWGVVSLCLVLFGVGAITIGFYESAFLFLAVVSNLLWRQRRSNAVVTLICIVFALIGTAVLYLAFSVVLGIPIPAGVLL